MIKKLSAYKIYLIFCGATSMLFWLVFTVSSVYQIDVIHLNPLQLILVGTTLEAACFVFEIPTGIVADIYSRKLSVIIGLVLIGSGFLVEGSIPLFAAVIASQLLWGIGYTFISGAVDAWIAEEDKTRELDHIYIKGSQAGQIGSIAGIMAATALGNVSVRLPIISSGGLFIVLALFLTCRMPEHNFKSSAPEALNTLGKMRHTLSNSMRFIKSKPIIMLLLAVTLFYGLSSEGYDRLYTAHFLKDTALPALGNLQPVTWFGIFAMAGMLLSTAAMQFAAKHLEKGSKLRNAGILLSTNIVYILCMAVFALTKNFALMLAAYLAISMAKTINEPILNAWLNSHIDDSARATVLSTNGQLNSLGQIIGGPIIGIIAVRTSVSTGIACTALLVSPVILLYVIILLRDRMSVKS